MSQFHGGFFVARTDANIVEPVYRAVVAYLSGARGDLSERRLTYAWRTRSPVVHVAVRGGDADGKGYAIWHLANKDLGSALARALGCDVWAYSYENQSGSEMTAHFDASGAPGEHVDASWDDMAEELEIDLDDDDDDGRAQLFEALPLGKLAERLGVERSLLEMELAYDTPTAAQSLAAPCDPKLLEAYFDGAGELPTSVSLYFPRSMWGDIIAAADTAHVPAATIVWLAWELGKAAVHELPGMDDSGHLAPKPPRPPKDLAVPDGSIQAAPPLEAAAGEPKVRVDLDLPTRLNDEVGELATFLDRSRSWVVQRAYTTSRDRVWAAAHAAPR